MDGLFGIDPEQLKALMAQFGASPEDQQAANKQALQALGFGLLQGRKGNELATIGQAGFGAMNARQQSLADAQSGKMRSIQTGLGLAKFSNELQNQQAQQAQQRQLQELTQRSGMPGMAPMGPPTASGEMQPEVQPSFDKQKFGAGLWQIDPSKAMAFEAAQAKESPFGKLDPKDYTQDSLRRFQSTGSQADLVPVGKPMIGNVTPAEYTSASVAKFTQSGNYADLVPRGMSEAEQMRIKLEQQRIGQAERHWQADHAEINPANLQETAKAIANYQQPPLTAWAMAKPQGQALMGEVMKVNPSYSAQDYAASQQSLKAFSTGKQGQAVNSFNVALSHLDTLQEAAKALKNGDVQMLNKVSNYYKQQSGNPAPTNFDGIKQVVGNEIIKAVVGSGAGVEDRKTAAEAIAKANSPAQLNGVIDKYKELMSGQLKGLRQQYEVTTKRKDFNARLSPQAQKLIGDGEAQVNDMAAADRILGK